MITIALLAYMTLHCIGILTSISQIGKDRKPLTASTAAGVTLVSLCMAGFAAYALLRG